ncbi:hypothetical protein PGB90_009004 [Kerria lacca]
MENASKEESQNDRTYFEAPGDAGNSVRRNGRGEELERKTEAKLRGPDIERYRMQVLCRDEETCTKKTGMQRRQPLVLKN